MTSFDRHTALVLLAALTAAVAAAALIGFAVGTLIATTTT